MRIDKDRWVWHGGHQSAFTVYDEKRADGVTDPAKAKGNRYEISSRELCQRLPNHVTSNDEEDGEDVAEILSLACQARGKLPAIQPPGPESCKSRAKPGRNRSHGICIVSMISSCQNNKR